MKSLERYAALVFPELPVGCGVDRALWAISGAVEAAAPALVQLSPFIVPLCIAATYLTARVAGVVLAALIAAVALWALFWAESLVKERAILRPPVGVLKPVTVGRSASSKVRGRASRAEGHVTLPAQATTSHQLFPPPRPRLLNPSQGSRRPLLREGSINRDGFVRADRLAPSGPYRLVDQDGGYASDALPRAQPSPNGIGQCEVPARSFSFRCAARGVRTRRVQR